MLTTKFFISGIIDNKSDVNESGDTNKKIRYFKNTMILLRIVARTSVWCK
jgi:hypothetical protein